jgi:ABC-type branched-subunit amino acid transport system ATPase component/branched-subunit amino acid ABC-type transport system permease component
MTKLLNLVLSGAVTGAIYSIMASGLVLTYSTSGIFNFGHAAIAFTAAYLYYQLNTGQGLAILPSVILVAFIFTPLLGLLLDRILLRRLAKAPVYARIVGTIGLLIALPNLVMWLVVTVGNDVLDLGLAGNQAQANGLSVPGIGPTPADVYHPISGVALDSDQIAIFVVAALAALGLWFVLRRTRVGLEMRAVVDREPLAGLRGVNPARTSAVAWMLSMVLAGLGGILIAPLFDLSDVTFTLVVLGSLAAVVLGGLRSLPIAFAGGLLLGVVQNLVAGYADDIFPKFISELTGLRSAVPYILVLIVGLIVGRDRTRKAAVVADDLPRPDHRAGLPTWRRRLPWALFTIAILTFSLHWLDIGQLQGNDYAQTVIAQSLATAIIFLSFVVVTGMGGMVSLAQATFVTAGGFGAGWALSRDWGADIPLIASAGQINWVLAALIGAVIAAAAGALIALPATRLGGVYLAIWTLAAAFFCSLVVFAYEPIGKGQLGWTIRAPSLDVAPLNWLNGFLLRPDLPWNVESTPLDFSQTQQQILLFFGVFGLVTLFIHRLQRSASGRAILAVRSTEAGAQASGVRANRTKIMMFALAAGIAGFGGVFLGLFSFTASNSTAPPIVGIFWLALAVTFGIRRPGGALLAGFAFAAGTAVFHWLADLLPGATVNELVSSVYFVPILSGLGAIQLAQEPDGILALVGQQKLEKRRLKERAARLAEMEAAAKQPEQPEPSMPREEPVTGARPAILTLGHPSPNGRHATPTAEGASFVIEGVVAGYGDAEVLHGVDLRLESGKIIALLGANGAGKSTLCSVAAGLVTPTFGTVALEGTDVTEAPPYQRARAGLLLVPEARGIFPGLTVDENLTVQLRSAEAREKAYERFPLLAQRRGAQAGVLSGGEQQMLSLAPALADPPKVLIADEPSLGLAPLAAEEVMRALVELRDAGCAILLVEEHARNALEVADTLAFMELGTIVWQGTVAEADMQLLGATYLGGSVSATP